MKTASNFSYESFLKKLLEKRNIYKLVIISDFKSQWIKEGGQIVIVIAIIGLVLVVFIVSRTKLKLKEK